VKETEQKNKAVSKGSDTEVCRILLVDDQAIIHEGLRRMLADAKDLELHCCTEGADALRMACEIQPSVILQDLVMPDVDGMMLVKYYRANDKTCDIPVVVLSSKEEAKTKYEAFTAGANDYLVKFPHQIEMLARLRYHAKTHAVLLERNAALEEVQRLSVTDGLTGLFNRRHFDMALAAEWKRAIRDRHPLSLVMLDVDHFKNFNDNYGHQAGDDCLVKVAQALMNSINRPADIIARYGGEEFIAIFPETAGSGALVMAENIRQAIIALKIPHEHSSAAKHITVSLGVASFVPEDGLQAESLLKSADQALYQAKEEGRNRVLLAE